MYTIEQIKKLKDKIVVWIENKEQHQRLSSIPGFAFCGFKEGAYYYSFVNAEYSSGTPKKGDIGAYKDKILIDYSEINLEEQYIPQIF